LTILKILHDLPHEQAVHFQQHYDANYAQERTFCRTRRSLNTPTLSYIIDVENRNRLLKSRQPMIRDVPLHKLIEMALAEDLGYRGDVTSRATLPTDATIRGVISAKSAGVVAGLPAVQMVYQQLDPDVHVVFHVQEGQAVQSGDSVCEVQGLAYSVLAGERTALNFLQRLSGIATLTHRFVEAVRGTQVVILDTRKTLPGWRLLDKYAVRMGGGQNHRIGLYDMVLIKDNHIDAAGGITQAVNAVRQHPEAAGLAIEVEVKDHAELHEALALHVDRILLDNMSLEAMTEAVRIRNASEPYIPLEASGNVRLETVRNIALTGVDYISVGALTHSAPVLDLSMRLVVPQPQAK
jgi:nicotinate-nucleotide pyrophosphorylase (carboxylating)